MTMNAAGRSVLDHLEQVARERQRRAADPKLARAVLLVKRFQHARFEATYRDLLASPRFAAAARFFLDDLYGPHDFTDRDAQFARIVPGLVRLFPADLVATVALLAELHALSEQLDSLMGAALEDGRLDAAAYARAWAAVGRREQRWRQIRLMRMVGDALDRYTRMRGLRHSLRLMRAPARVAKLTALHQFLERGFDTFRDLGGAAEFLDLIENREKGLATALFEQRLGLCPDDIGAAECQLREMGQLP